ncbi:T9SS type A sorting domain-containing protein [Dokdonia sp.]|uniref:T9SS type A sorting domain-containing protein n=1 Tax=Dokdonia sp. TaxID=2024995 RepID=UPI003267F178
MKKGLLIFLILQCAISYAQDFSLTDQGNRWGVRYYDGFCDPDNPDTMGCSETNLNGYRINGEVIINDITYAVLEATFNDNNPNWNTYLFLREENGIVYSYTETQGEQILYNFTLEVGDSIEIGFGGDCFDDENNNQMADVIDVSTQFIAGQNRKVITFDVFNNTNFSNSYVQWIEGLGDTGDLISPIVVFCDTPSFLNCFNNGNELFIFAENEEDCDSLLSISEIQKTTATLTPNPITDQSIVTINNPQNNTTIAFYNLLGQLISQEELTSNTTVINRSDFPSNGIYFYQIQQQGQVLETQKFIVK